MFPTTVWTRIHDAGRWDRTALEEFAERYRAPVLMFIQRRGFDRARAEDLCQDVFVRVLRGEVLAKADATRGRFRTLLLTVTTRVIQDHVRKRRELTTPEIEATATTDDADFDHSWALHMVERALERLREEGSPYHGVLSAHVAGERQSRQRLWNARRRLAAKIRQEVAETCATREDFEREMAYLARYLRGRES